MAKKIFSFVCIVLCFVLCYQTIICVASELGAAEWKIPVISAEEINTPGVSVEVLLGDTNNDGKVIASDARRALRKSAELPVGSPFYPAACDVNRDGKTLSSDARIILRFSAQLILDYSGTLPEIQTIATTVPPTTQPVTKDPATIKVAFIGDSLVASFSGYEIRTDVIDSYGRVSLSTQGIFSYSTDYGSVPIIDELYNKEYDAVVLLIGINEASGNNDSFRVSYSKIIDGIKQRRPNAEIYCHALLPVTQHESDTNRFGCTNEAILSKNAVIESVAAEKGVHFIDAGEIFRNEYGTLNDDVASDGIHPKKPYCEQWANWILSKITIYQ